MNVKEDQAIEMFAALTQALDLWGAGMRGEDLMSGVLGTDRSMFSLRRSPEGERALDDGDGTVDQHDSLKGWHHTEVDESVPGRSPFEYGSMADAYPNSKEERPLLLMKPGVRPRAKSLWARQPLADTRVHEGFGQQTASEVISRSPAISLGNNIPAYSLDGHSTPPPDMSDSHYWDKYMAWSKHDGHTLENPLQQAPPASPRSSVSGPRSMKASQRMNEQPPPSLPPPSPPPVTPKKHITIHSRPHNSGPATNSVAGTSVSMPKQRIPQDMSSMDAGLMQHLREAHARAQDPLGGYSAATAGDPRWSEMTYSWGIPKLVYPARETRVRTEVVEERKEGGGLVGSEVDESDEEFEAGDWLEESKSDEEGR